MKKLALALLALLAVFYAPAQASPPRACLAHDLAARAAFQGGTGADEGGIALRNRSATSCRVFGRAILDFVAGGRRLAIRNVVGKATDGARRERTILLAPGDRAFVHARWSNWCGARYPRVAVRMWIQTTDPKVAVAGTVASPRCDDPAAGSLVAVGPFERARHYP
jgi:hypothetical protein